LLFSEIISIETQVKLILHNNMIALQKYGLKLALHESRRHIWTIKLM